MLAISSNFKPDNTSCFTSVPADTFPVGAPTAVILATVLNEFILVAVPAFAPATSSSKTAPAASVPTTVNLINESLPTEAIVTFWATEFVTDPLSTITPPRTRGAFSATVSSNEIPSASLTASYFTPEIVDVGTTVSTTNAWVLV